MAAGSVTITEETHGTIKKIKFDWTSGTGDDEGKASGQTTNPFSGKILGLATNPDGVAAPTADYDITVTDEDDMDVLMGGGANRHTSTTEYVLSTSLGAVANDKLTINVTNAGAAKKGVAYLYIR